MRVDAIVLVLVACAASSCSSDDCAIFPLEVGEPGELAPPPGYVAATVLSNLELPTQLQFDASGRLFVLEGGHERTKSLRVFARDFVESSRIPLETWGESTGLLVLGAGETVLVGSRGRIDTFREVGGTFVGPTPWLVDLPHGDHTNNGMALGPDGFVYFTVGSTCDVCDEPDARSATVMRARSDRSAPTAEIFASGLRNAYDLAFTDRGELLASDNGPECCGSRSRCTGPGVDRLLQVSPGSDHGWPGAYMGRGVAAALAPLPLHAGAAGVAFRPETPECGGGGVVFVALWCTQHGRREAGRRVLRVRLERDEAGRLTARAPDVFLGPEGLGHPIDVAFGPDGALHVLDFDGRVVRVARSGGDSCM